MKRFLPLIFLLLAALRVGAAVGQIIGANVETNGWVLSLTFNGMTNKGVARMGLSEPYRSLTATTTVSLLVYDFAYNSLGNVVSNSRTIYATRELRSPYPNVTSNEFIPDFSGIVSNCVGRFALSDWVYANTLIASITVRTGLYSANNIVSHELSGASWTTNSSTNSYLKPVGNWSIQGTAPFERVSATAHLKAVGWGHHPSGGNSGIACVKFWLNDTNGHVTATQTVTRPTLVTTEQGLGQCLWSADISISTLSYGLITQHFEMFPAVGTNTLSTADGRFSFPTVETAPMPAFNGTGRSNVTYALVDTINGVDANGVVTTNFNPANVPAPFKLLSAAATAIGRFNATNFGRADVSEGVIVLTNGNYSFVGGTVTITNKHGATYLTLMPFPGTARSAVVITNASGSQHLGHLLCLSNITISSINAPATFNDADYFLLDRCAFPTNTGTTIFGTVTNLYFRYCTISNLLMNPASSNPNNFRNTEACDLTGQGNIVSPMTVLGNLRDGPNNSVLTMLQQEPTVNGRQPAFRPIIAYNRFRRQKILTGNMIDLFTPGSLVKNTNGFAVVENEFENVNGSNGVARLFSCSVASSFGDTNDLTGLIIWNNTAVGQRWNMGDNASSGSSISAVRQLWSVHNNLWVQMNTKSDQVSSANGAHLGQLPLSYGVNWNCNTDFDPGVAAYDSGSWFHDLQGLNSVMNTNWGVGTSTGFGPNAVWYVFPRFAAPNFASGDTNVVEGGGNYHLNSGSPLTQLYGTWDTPYDLDGSVRNAGDPPGAYVINLRRSIRSGKGTWR
jgi:hypothetical protein